MKYEVGDEVLVRARIIRSYADGKYIIEINEDGYYKTFDHKGNDIFPYPSMTAEEAWEISKKLFSDYSNSELDEIFGKGWSYPKLMEMTPQQAKERIEAWEEKNEIKVGDEVIPKKDHYRSGERGLVVFIGSRGKIGVIHTGNDFTWYEKESIEKTGRHIDIGGLLEQIGGNE